MKNIKTYLTLAAIILIAPFAGLAQKKSAEEIRQLVESRNLVFKAQMANPQGMMSRQLTPEYDLTIRPGEIVSYLPYFGRAYVAPINPSEGGIKFSSTKFDYKQSHDKKRWTITIKPKDASDVQQLSLEIFDNGNASLQVLSTNRQPISFNGYVEENKSKKAF